MRQTGDHWAVRSLAPIVEPRLLAGPWDERFRWPSTSVTSAQGVSNIKTTLGKLEEIVEEGLLALGDVRRSFHEIHIEVLAIREELRMEREPAGTPGRIHQESFWPSLTSC